MQVLQLLCVPEWPGAVAFELLRTTTHHKAYMHCNPGKCITRCVASFRLKGDPAKFEPAQIQVSTPWRCESSCSCYEARQVHTGCRYMGLCESAGLSFEWGGEVWIWFVIPRHTFSELGTIFEPLIQSWFPCNNAQAVAACHFSVSLTQHSKVPDASKHDFQT